MMSTDDQALQAPSGVPEAVAAEIHGPSVYDVFKNSFVTFWSSVKLAVVLILAIAIASTIGTTVPQGDAAGILAIEGMSDRAKQILINIQAYNIYYSPWFLGLLALFFFNLAVCTYVRVWPRLRFALQRPRDIPEKARDFMPEQAGFPGVSVETLAKELSRKRYRVFPSPDGGLVADQNRLARFAPMIVHIGLFSILIGGITAGLSGFKHSFPLLPGEAMPVRQAMKDAKTRGWLTPIPRDWKIRLDKFWMTYYPDGSVKQFYSTLSVVDKGAVVHTETIHVNEPLAYEGVYFYQSFFGIGAANLTVDRGIRTQVVLTHQEGASIKLQGFITTKFPFGGREVFGYSAKAGEPMRLLTFPDMQSLGTLSPDTALTAATHSLKLGKVMAAPGLSGVALDIAGKRHVLSVESANRFKLSGFISRQFPVGNRKCFLFVAQSEAPIQIVDLDSFATLAKLDKGKTALIAGVPVRFVSEAMSEGAGGLVAAEIIQDGVPTSMRMIDLTRTGFRVSGPSSDVIELGGRKVLLIQNTEPPGSPLWIVDKEQSLALAVLNPGDVQQVGNVKVRFDEGVYFSGLQTKSDPGIPVIYSGFFIVILGTLLGMFSHRQVWVTRTEDGCKLGGKANRGPYLFHLEMGRLAAKLTGGSTNG